MHVIQSIKLKRGLGALGLFVIMVLAGNGAKASDKRPNVLFLAVDDMRDWVNCLGGYEGTVHTPNIDRLARRGVLFTNAHCASTVCCPSRTAIMLGKMPSTTGVYNNGQWWRPHLPEVMTLPDHFGQCGYRVAGAGKLFHHTAGNNPPYQWDSFSRLLFRDDPWYRGNKLNYPWSQTGPAPKGFPFCGFPGLPHESDWGVLPNKVEATYDDAVTVDYACQFLKQPQRKPFFLACGLFRPHLPWYAPAEYFDLYPLEEIQLPLIHASDLDDIPDEGRKLSKARRKDFDTIKSNGKWKQAVQAYLASISFADAQLGRVLDALDQSSYANDTIVMLWSDHGWHLGEKDHWHKSTLWEEATRVPLVVYAPGYQGNGRRCAQPVSLVDLYPTLVELCRLTPNDGLDGQSLVPHLRNPEAKRERPAVIQYKRGQCAVRTERYRYIRYEDGSEELYDHSIDPNEWNNLADSTEVDSVKAKQDIAEWVTKDWALPAPSKNAYRFDPDMYTWTRKATGETVEGNGD